MPYANRERKRAYERVQLNLRNRGIKASQSSLPRAAANGGGGLPKEFNMELEKDLQRLVKQIRADMRAIKRLQGPTKPPLTPEMGKMLVEYAKTLTLIRGDQRVEVMDADKEAKKMTDEQLRAVAEKAVKAGP